MNHKLAPEILEEIRRERDAARAFVKGIRDEKFLVVIEALEVLRYSVHGYDGRAFRAAAAVQGVSRKFRLLMLEFFVQFGDTLRSAAPHDFALLDFLWAVLPPYRGKAAVLFRAESFWNRQRRTYGLSWTASEDVARQIAHRPVRYKDNVVIRAEAGADAIVCAPSLLNDRYGEQEYIVDRRRLHRVEVIERVRRERKP